MTSARRPHVAVVDSGITPELRSDGWLEDVERTTSGCHAHETHGNVDDLHYVPDSPRLEYGAGHGTFVAGVIAQVCPPARISMFRAFRADGLASELEVACALIRAAEAGADVVNLSLGHQTLDDEPSLPLEMALRRLRALEEQSGRHVVVVAAAGNFGDDRPTWPAASEGVVAVGALDAALRRAPWSSYGPWVDVATVGEGVLSTYVPGTTYDDAGQVLDTFGANSFARWTGTSFAAPQVAGAIAAHMARTGSSSRAARDAVLADAVHLDGAATPVLTVLPGC